MSRLTAVVFAIVLSSVVASTTFAAGPVKTSPVQDREPSPYEPSSYLIPTHQEIVVSGYCVKGVNHTTITVEDTDYTYLYGDYSQFDPPAQPQMYEGKKGTYWR